MKRIGNLYDRICDPDNLRLAMKKSAKGKKWRRGIRNTLAHSEAAVEELHRLLTNCEYRTSRYHDKVVYEPKKRTIYSLPFFPDRIAHHAIMNVLEPVWDALLDYDCHSCRKGKGCHTASKRCMDFVRKYDYVVQCDISKFYPSLDHNIIKSVVRKKIKDERLLWLLDEIIESSDRIPNAVKGRNAPIGNLLSQWFGNLYLNEMDLWLRQEVEIPDMIRYCDDFLLFGPDKGTLSDVQRQLPDFLGDVLRLSLSKASLYPTQKGIDFVGYRHFPKYILVRKRVAKKIKRFCKRALADEFGNFQHAKGVAASYNGVLKHANTYNFRQSIKFDEVLAKYGIAQ